MEDGNGRKKVWICLSIVVLAAVVIGAVYYMNMPKEHSEEGFLIGEKARTVRMASGKTLYIKGDRDVEVTKPDVTSCRFCFLWSAPISRFFRSLKQ